MELLFPREFPKYLNVPSSQRFYYLSLSCHFVLHSGLETIYSVFSAFISETLQINPCNLRALLRHRVLVTNWTKRELRVRCENVLNGCKNCWVMNFSCFLEGKCFSAESVFKRAMCTLIISANFGTKLLHILRKKKSYQDLLTRVSVYNESYYGSFNYWNCTNIFENTRGCSFKLLNNPSKGRQCT
jgi:hypothetical protein